MVPISALFTMIKHGLKGCELMEVIGTQDFQLTGVLGIDLIKGGIALR